MKACAECEICVCPRCGLVMKECTAKGRELAQKHGIEMPMEYCWKDIELLYRK